MDIAEIKNQIEKIFPNYSNYWFDLMEDSEYDEETKRMLIGLISEEIAIQFKSINGLKNKDSKVILIEEIIKQLEAELEKANEDYLAFAKQLKHKIYDEIYSIQAERNKFFVWTKNKPKIEFWKWYLKYRLGTEKEEKGSGGLDDYLTAEKLKQLIETLKYEKIINKKEQWIYGKKVGAIVAVVDVMIDRGGINSKYKDPICKLLAKRFGTSITSRTIRNKDSFYKDDLKKKFEAILG